ncbi:zinc ABC transporter substrate-binding protein [uncultured Corynebacterium sp.]|uniref:metal ABC transporter solute-binding protein, Zn/Mn family n=1 Tax=uncultured Corynebacterium sp. TaxID=159447 RepID=UPI0025DF6AF3|nr:zinc ABC transporter substrate-binding protein [uncultured Corynebacterium sp.]
MISSCRIPGIKASLAAVLSLTAVACSSSDDSASGSKDSADGTVNIVASTPIWANVAEVVAESAGVDIEVTSVITDPSVDPHHFEPTAADVARANDADITVVGGGGYDAWLYEAVKDQDKIVTALPLIEHGTLEDHMDESKVPVIDGNEHIWYDVAAINLVAEEIADAINAKDPEAKASADGLEEKTKGFTDRIAALQSKKYAQTEPIADYLLSPSSWTDVTPKGYRAATIDEGEPSAADLARFLEAIKAKDLDILIFNPQTETDMAARIRDAAKDAGIPIVEIGETPVDGENFFDYYDKVITDVEATAK